MQANSTEKSAIVKGGVDLVKVRDAITPILVAHGVDLVELTWATDQGGWTLRLTIERLLPPGAEVAPAAETNYGVTLEDCVDVSRDVSQLLDVEDLIAQHYNLEVSSPGLDRKLRGPADYVRFRGQLVKVKLTKPASDGQRVLRGTLEEAADGYIGVRVDGKSLRAPFEDIEEARLVFELVTGEKKGQSKGGKKGKSPAGKTAAIKAGGDAERGAAAGNQDRRGPSK